MRLPVLIGWKNKGKVDWPWQALWMFQGRLSCKLQFRHARHVLAINDRIRGTNDGIANDFLNCTLVLQALKHKSLSQS